MDLNRLLVDPTGVQTWRLGESELLTSTTELSQRIGELEALRLRMVHEVDTRGTAKPGSTVSPLMIIRFG